VRVDCFTEPSSLSLFLGCLRHLRVGNDCRAAGNNLAARINAAKGAFRSDLLL
jgi:hypothetical protein